RAWLIRVAVNTAKNKRNYNARHSHLDFDALEDFLICSEEHEDRMDIPLLATLPLKYRKALYLRYVEDLSVEEISKIESTTVFAVKHRLQRGKALLKKQYEVSKNEKK
ncbi:MAG: RNA polymerase sigma factor, partial [Clostridia bacterium]|nr:RNA polymerase sigma factor [Clostridia bacterium]